MGPDLHHVVGVGVEVLELVADVAGVGDLGSGEWGKGDSGWLSPFFASREVERQKKPAYCT